MDDPLVEQVRIFTSEALSVEPGALAMDANFMDDLGASVDEMDMLVATIQPAFGLADNLPDDETDAWLTLDDILASFTRAGVKPLRPE